MNAALYAIRSCFMPIVLLALGTNVQALEILFVEDGNTTSPYYKFKHNNAYVDISTFNFDS